MHIILKQHFDEMITCYKKMLTYIRGSVTRNSSEKSINSILDHVSTSDNVKLSHNIMEFQYSFLCAVDYTTSRIL